MESVLPGVFGLPLSRRPLLSTHELAQADRVTSRLVDRLAFSARAMETRAGIELTGVTLGRLRVFGVRHAMATAVHSDALRSHHVIVPLEGLLHARSVDNGFDIGAGAAFVYPAGSHLDVYWAGPSTALVVTVDRDVFDRYCAGRTDAALPPPLLPATLSLTAGAGRSFANLLACLCSECNGGSSNPDVVCALEGLVLSSLADLARAPMSLPTGVRSTARRRSGLLRALEYLRRHPREHPGIEELARVACLSRRSLETAFIEHMGTGPREYVTRERLRGARRELLARVPDAISTIAARWGFDDPSRFARLYRHLFGELPSVTRARVSRHH